MESIWDKKLSQVVTVELQYLKAQAVHLALALVWHTLASLWACTVFIFFSHGVEVIIKLCTLF
jgi:hypothetical protein